MYQYYDLTFNTGYKLTYKLEHHRPAQVWAGLMFFANVNDLRPTLNPWRDFDKSILPAKIKYLEQLARKLNTWLPNKILDKWDHNNHQASVNKFHVHFPEQEKSETDPERRSQLSEYNDLIHEIEILALGNNKKQIPHLLICPDVNITKPLEDKDYKFFTVQRKFGELCLHYCHVGRHPFELYAAWDTDCPIDQIVPQTLISTFHTCRFYTDPIMDHWHKPKFREFYNKSTLRQVMKYNDPKMAFGYIPIGSLITNESENQVLHNVKESNKISEWKIYN